MPLLYVEKEGNMLKTISKNASSEIIEKKSKFIADIIYVQTEEEAQVYINQIKKKHYNAKHHCYAYRILTNTGIISKSSDDGEPSGTAGAPILNIINKNELINVLIVVTRYFGGVLLGTGGLFRAYSECTLKAINNVNFIIEERGFELELEINYNDFEKLKFYCKKNNINIIKCEYKENIVCYIELNCEEKEKLIDKIKELSFKIEKYTVLKEKNIRKSLTNE